MWGRKSIDDSKFERLEAELFRALEANEAEVEAAANSPFLYQRLRTRLDAEIKRRSEPGKEWLAWLVAARQAAPALTLVALLALGVFWTVGKSNSATGLNAQGGAETALSDELSNDDVLAELVGWEESGNGTAQNSVKERQ
jgi:hypothetical protein